MSTKFFNNENGDTLFAKLKGIVGGMGVNFHTLQAVSGYFRSSGYFKLRNELKDTQKIQVLVGIDIDNVFRKDHPQFAAALAAARTRFSLPDSEIAAILAESAAD